MSIALTSTNPDGTPPKALKREARPSTSEPQVVRSEDLLRGMSCVTLSHQGMRYILRQTRQGKLILTK